MFLFAEPKSYSSVQKPLQEDELQKSTYTAAVKARFENKGTEEQKESAKDEEKMDDLAARRAARRERRKQSASSMSESKASETNEDSADGTSGSRSSLAAKRAERRARCGSKTDDKLATDEGEKTSSDSKIEEVQSAINERRAARRAARAANSVDEKKKEVIATDDKKEEDTLAAKRQERRERAERRRSSSKEESGKEALIKRGSTSEEDQSSETRKTPTEEKSNYTATVKSRFEKKGSDENINSTSHVRRSRQTEDQNDNQRNNKPSDEESIENHTQVYVLSLLPGVKIRAGQWTMSGLKLCSPVMFTSHANPHSLTNRQIHVLTLNLGFFSFFTRMQIKNFTRISQFFPNILTSQKQDLTEQKCGTLI